MSPSGTPPAEPDGDRVTPSPPGDAREEGPPPARWRVALKWGERALWVGVLIFASIRLGPQLGALLGVGPALGAAPEFTLETLDGRVIGPDDLRGKVVVVNFWATWCPPCRIEIPSLQKLHEDLGPEGVVVLGLSTDVAGDARVREFLDERGVTYPVGIASGRVRRDFGGIGALPTTFILDREGVIRHRVLGFFAPPAMRVSVRRLLTETATDSGA